VFGWPLIYWAKKPSPRQRYRIASVDRIVPELGYARGNIRVISLRANMLRSNATFEEIALLHAWLRRVTTPAEVEFRLELKQRAYRAKELYESDT